MMNHLRETCRAWFARLASREQLCLLCGGAAVFLYLLLTLIWLPLSSARDEMAERNEQAARQLAQVRLLAAELLQQSGAGAAWGGERNLNQLINRTTGQFAIRPSRIQPNARGEVQVRFDEVEFAGLMRWLHQMELREGARLLEVSIHQGGDGAVQASVRVGQ